MISIFQMSYSAQINGYRYIPMSGNVSLVGGKFSPIINMKTASDSMTDSCTSILASLWGGSINAMIVISESIIQGIAMVNMENIGWRLKLI